MKKLELIKETEASGKVWYLVKVDGWGQGAFRSLSEARCRFKECKRNIKNGCVGREVLKSINVKSG